jgi:hypothetical protein
LVLTYAGYNHWANEKLSNWLMSLDRKLLKIIANKTLPLPAEANAAGTNAADLNFSLLLAGSRLILDTIAARSLRCVAASVSLTTSPNGL